jgi:hypothetical protein
MSPSRVIIPVGHKNEWEHRTNRTMLQYIRAERNGIWSMHLSSVRSMLPFVFVTNRNNYSRWTHIYLLEDLALLC